MGTARQPHVPVGDRALPRGSVSANRSGNGAYVGETGGGDSASRARDRPGRNRTPGAGYRASEPWRYGGFADRPGAQPRDPAENERAPGAWPDPRRSRTGLPDVRSRRSSAVRRAAIARRGRGDLSRARRRPRPPGRRGGLRSYGPEGAIVICPLFSVPVASSSGASKLWAASQMWISKVSLAWLPWVAMARKW